MAGKQAQKVTWVLQLIEELETVPATYLKKLVGTEDIWEVRVQLAGNIFRLLGFFTGPARLILTNGFQKKTQKTPTQEIKLAETYKREYLKRVKHE